MRVALETDRLVLREFVRGDLDALAAILCDRRNMRYYPHAFSRLDARQWIERNLPRYPRGVGLWAVIPRGQATLIGDCGLVWQQVEGVEELEVAYHFHPAWQGKGYATEAARACLNYAFEVLRVTRVISLIRPENRPSWRVAERNGMTVEKETLHAGLRHRVYVASR